MSHYPQTPKIIGLIAGGGELPLAFARQARKKGFSLRTVAVQGVASKRLNSLSDEILWISPAQLGKLISFFKKNRVRRTVLQGKMEHSAILKNPKLDFRSLWIFLRLKDRSGEAILRALADELGRNGIRVIDSRFLMDEFLAAQDSFKALKPGGEAEKNIRYGFEKAKALARLAVGQTVVVKRNSIVAVEGVEGTDEAIRRAGQWVGPGTIMVKVSSPRQDWRFDVPTIGFKTVQTLARARAAGIAVEAGRVFILDQEKIFTYAKKHGLFVTTVS